MRKVIVMSGIPGSGKSEYARAICAAHVAHHGVIFSTDDYYMVDGAYVYDSAKIGDAHADCFRRYLDYIREHSSTSYNRNQLVIVDNTSTMVEEIAPYMLGAAAYGWEAEIRTIVCASVSDTWLASKRCTHGTEAKVILAYAKDLQARKLPEWWKNTDIPLHKG